MKLKLLLNAQRGTRTHTPLRATDFKSVVSTIPPPGHNLTTELIIQILVVILHKLKINN